jgi:DNA-binding protein YbaB
VAERLHNMLPPQALGGPSPQMLEMQKQLQQAQGALQTMTQTLADAKSKHMSSEQQKDIDAYKAETDRAAVLKDIDPTLFEPMLRKLVAEAMQSGMGPVIGSSQQFIEQTDEASQAS